ncbi:hypothetical protein, partial [Micromonospora sp. 4G55]|uniref:hypothetical protein n=1 Tax=Micromonospora sp. 4G55 TaxID=2806102 RepID=UPI0035C6AD4A
MKPYQEKFCNRSPTAAGSSTTSYRPGGSSTGSAAARALPAARAPSAAPSRSASRRRCAVVRHRAGHPGLDQRQRPPGGALQVVREG